MPWADFLFKEFEVIPPVFEGDEAEVRAYHEENLSTRDAIVIFYGAANDIWLRRKLREIQKSAGYGADQTTAGRGDMPRATEDAREGAVPHPRSAARAAVGRPRG